MDLHYVPFTDEAKASVLGGYPFYREATIPASTYRGMDADYAGLDVGSMHLIASAKTSDDTVYECPGLAATATAMGDMVVKNPFYLQGDLDLDLGVGGAGRGGASGASGRGAVSASDPQPISSQSSIFHHGIKGVN